MKETEDLTGKRFGRWTVLRKTDKYTKSGLWYYMCRCDCGTEKEVSSHSLKYGRSLSCGCVGNEKFQNMALKNKGKNSPSFKDLTGKRFGSLTVVREHGQNKYGNFIWECKCDCGNICYSDTAHLTRGSKTNCGCKRAKDMQGMRFGMLTVVERVGSLSHGEMFWKCKCDCGNEVVVRGSLLRNGGTKSCGCYHKIATQKFRKQNEYRVDGNTIYVTLPNTNQEMICDADDWEKLKKFRWFIGSHGYATTNVPKDGERKKETSYFHKFVLSVPPGFLPDHINRNRLDNRKENLRIATITENVINRGVYKNNTSGVRGVYFNKRRNKWVARITYNKKVISLGYFDNLEEAKNARLNAEKEYFGGLIDSEAL